MSTEILIKKIRKYNSFVLVFGILYLIQNFTIGQLNIEFNFIKIGFVFLKEIIFLISSFTICKILLD